MSVSAKKNSRSTKKRIQPSLHLLNLQSALLRELRKIAVFACICGAPIYLYVITIPEQRKLETLQQTMSDAIIKEQLALEANDRIMREISAYRSNPDYLEIIARDHLNYYKQGEKIIRITR